jgi:hypothetical protein
VVVSSHHSPCFLYQSEHWEDGTLRPIVGAHSANSLRFLLCLGPLYGKSVAGQCCEATAWEACPNLTRLGSQRTIRAASTWFIGIRGRQVQGRQGLLDTLNRSGATMIDQIPLTSMGMPRQGGIP